jgi:hypothetical protein
MATQIDLLKAEIARIERELQAVQIKIRHIEGKKPTPRTFADLEGVWEGSDSTYEDVRAHEYKIGDKEWQ